MKSRFQLLSVAVLSLGLMTAGCMTTDPYTGEQKVNKKTWGAGIGAAIGAVAGALTGDDADERRKRALIGAGVGALAGTAVGAYMDAQEAKLRDELAGTGVSLTRIGDDLVLNMPGNVTFPVNQDDVRGDFLPVLNSVGKVLTEYDQTLVDVTGHTDSTGAYNHNMQLSEQRAANVGRYLQTQGIEPMRVSTQGYGPDHPVADNATSGGRQQNRRVELILKPLTQSGV